MVRLSRTSTLGGTVEPDGPWAAPVRPPVLLPWLRRSVGARLPSPPRAEGWCRTRWRGATWALALQATHGLEGAAWTVRRWLHALGWVGKRATLGAKEDEPPRVERVARRRCQAEPWPAPAVLVGAAARARPVWPKVGAAWRPQGTQEARRTPGKNAQPSLAGGRTLAPGALLQGFGPRQTPALFRALLGLLERTSPEPWVTRLFVGVEPSGRQQAKAVEPGLASPPRLTGLGLPTSGPRAHPMERAGGDGHDKGTRNHKRQR